MAKSNEEVYSEWKTLVNMTPKEIEDFLAEYGDVAGLSRKEASAQGIKSGRDSARAIIRMKRKGRKNWKDSDWAWARRQVNFIKRMSGAKGALHKPSGEPTRKYLSLLVWGHDPKKMKKNGGMNPNPLADLAQNNVGLVIFNDFDIYAQRQRDRSRPVGEERPGIAKMKEEIVVIAIRTDIPYDPERLVVGGLWTGVDQEKNKDGVWEKLSFVSSSVAKRGYGPWLYWGALYDMSRRTPHMRLWSDSSLTSFSSRIWETFERLGWATMEEEGDASHFISPRYAAQWQGDQELTELVQGALDRGSAYLKEHEGIVSPVDLDSVANQMFRDYYSKAIDFDDDGTLTPELTANPSIQYAGILLHNERDDTVMLLRRSLDGYWSIPGGHIEKGETPEVAAIREFEEETGFQGPEPDMLTVLHSNRRYLVFVVPVQGTFQPQLDHEHTEHVWASLHDLPDSLYPGFEDLLLSL